MTLDAMRLEVPEIHEHEPLDLHNLLEQLADLPRQASSETLETLLGRLFQLNRRELTLLERQRILQSFTEHYRLQAQAFAEQPPCPLFIRLCLELAAGFKRLLLQILQGRQPSRPHLAWCLYMAEYFVAQSLLRHYQLYQEPPGSLWHDCHLLYWLGERQHCLDEPVAAAFQPAAASNLRGLYQQSLLLALSNPFQLENGQCLQLFAALAPLAELARLQPWEADDDSEGLLIDLGAEQPQLLGEPDAAAEPATLRRLELGALLVALDEPTPLQSASQRQLLEQARPHWQGQQARRHPRSEQSSPCNLFCGIAAIHAQLLEQRPLHLAAQLLDASAGGARLLCHADHAAQLPIGQLLLLQHNNSQTLALLRWRHQSGSGLHLGLRYLKGLPRPVWLRRAPSAKTHPGILQSTPANGGWHHGLWLAQGDFASEENLWLQLQGNHHQAIVQLPPANLDSGQVARHPLKLA